jgi:hypothetical protein
VADQNGARRGRRSGGGRATIAGWRAKEGGPDGDRVRGLGFGRQVAVVGRVRLAVTASVVSDDVQGVAELGREKKGEMERRSEMEMMWTGNGRQAPSPPLSLAYQLTFRARSAQDSAVYPAPWQQNRTGAPGGPSAL